MKKIIFLTVILFLLFPSPSLAQANVNLPASGYKIKDFQSEISVNQDASLAVQETIKVNFFEQKHGIFRIIPVIYSAKGKTIRAKLKVLSVTDEIGNSYPYETSRYNQSIKIKIGDPNQTITGRQTYVIQYTINRVLLRYSEHDEVYWNVAGSEWDTTIENASATVKSPYAKIIKTECFSGRLKSQDRFCQAEFDEEKAQFSSTTSLGRGLDFTIVVGLNKNNQLQFPGLLQGVINLVLDNWGYPVALAPLSIIFFSWYKRGRDKRYLSDNIYYQPKDQKTRTVSLFEHKHLPLVYSPIDQVTPAQVGTIIDERIDIQDVVAEIVELARLGFLEIKKIEKKGFLRQKTDYLFIKKDKDPKDLKDYQKYLLDKLFFGQKINKLLKEALKSANLSQETIRAFATVSEKEPTITYENAVLLSSLKNKFYKYLEEFKKKLYENLADEEIFATNPEITRRNWLGSAIFLLAVSLGLTILFSILYLNAGPILLLLITPVPTVMFAGAMPRRRAWGYSLYRQAEGLRYYLKLGKWRSEIHEKHLFFEEILPLAISLGVVRKLARDMAVLGVEPPSYFTGVAVHTFSRDFSSFNRSTRSSLLSSPTDRWSGRSSWSGGSGFSGGGSAGGGFGGGGGGSW